MGDYGECINAKDDRFDYASIDPNYMTPVEQYEEVTNHFMSIRDKIITVLDGNHEYNFYTRTGHHYARKMATDLDVAYGTFSSYIRLKMRREVNNNDRAGANFNIYAHHGWSGARSDGGAVNSIYDLRNKFNDCHLYIMGHLHHKIGAEPPKVQVYVPDVYKRDGNYNPMIREFVQHFVWSGSYVKLYEDNPKGSSYAERKGYNPSALGSPIIEVKPNRVDGTTSDKMVPPFSVRTSSLDFYG
jgi:hypothetical protein